PAQRGRRYGRKRPAIRTRLPWNQVWGARGEGRGSLFIRSPDLACQGGPGLLHERRDRLAPARLLASEEARRYLKGSAGVVERESVAPGPRDVSEVLLGEGPRDRPQPVVGQREAVRHAGKLRQEGGGIQDGISLSQEIEIEEVEAIAVQQEVIGPEI